MELESLSPNLLRPVLENRLSKLQNLLNETQKSCQKASAGRIRIAQKQGHPDFYLVTDRGSLEGQYIPRSKLTLIKQLLQKDYNQKLITLLQKEISVLQKYLQVTHNCKAITELYTKLCPVRRNHIKPVTLTNEQYSLKWQSVEYQGHPFAADTPEYQTARGERVRSKSEVIIADTLTRHHIPYRYEYPLKIIKGSQPLTIYPDFLCLNIHTRQEFLWEHFGMMDDPDYAQKATSKLRLLQENGILPGRNLILTMETQNTPLSTRVLEKIIKEFFENAEGSV